MSVTNALYKQRAMLENVFRAVIGLAPINHMNLDLLHKNDCACEAQYGKVHRWLINSFRPMKWGREVSYAKVYLNIKKKIFLTLHFSSSWFILLKVMLISSSCIVRIFTFCDVSQVNSSNSRFSGRSCVLSILFLSVLRIRALASSWLIVSEYSAFNNACALWQLFPMAVAWKKLWPVSECFLVLQHCFTFQPV